MLQGESTLIKPANVKYYSRMEESESNPDIGATDNGHHHPDDVDSNRTFSIEK